MRTDKLFRDARSNTEGARTLVMMNAVVSNSDPEVFASLLGDIARRIEINSKHGEDIVELHFSSGNFNDKDNYGYNFILKHKKLAEEIIREKIGSGFSIGIHKEYVNGEDYDYWSMIVIIEWSKHRHLNKLKNMLKYNTIIGRVW